MTTLITTADDVGLSRGINAAVAQLAAQRRLTTASVMANVAYLDDAAQMLRRHDHLMTGAHLNISDGTPLTRIHPATGLVGQDGRFRGRRGLLVQALRPSAAFLQAAEAEFDAQIETLRGHGLAVSHLSSHLHWQVFPALQRLVEKVARRHTVAWLRQHRLARVVIPQNPLQRRVATPSPDSPDYLTDVHAWMGLVPPARMAARLARLHGTLEVVVHPSLDNDPTYPAGLTNKPASRYRQMRFFQQVMASADFALHDPA